MSSIDVYKQALNTIVYEHKGFENVPSPKWKELVSMITDEVLLDAHNSYKKYEQLFNGLYGESRPLKTMKRIQIKSQGTRDDVPFKVNSDLCAVRFPTYDIKQISKIMNDLRERVIDEEGIFQIRNSIQDTNNNINDIIQYAFAYVPSIGYIIEIQVGHPFAMYTFKIDSIIRDKRINGQSLEGIVDLWDNGFYDFVKSIILNKKNCMNITIDDFIKAYPSKEDIKNDNELMNILHKILITVIATM